MRASPVRALLAALPLALAAVGAAAGPPEGVPSETAASATPRITPAPDHPPDPILAGMFAAIRARGAEPLNMHRALGIAAPLFQAYANMAFAIRDKAVVPRRDRELIILRTVQLAGGAYEMQQHRPMALSCGITRAQLDALPAWPTSPAFDERERALLAYADAMASGQGVGDDVFGRLRRHYDERAIVELTIAAGFYDAAARVTRALAVPLEAVREGEEGGYGRC